MPHIDQKTGKDMNKKRKRIVILSVTALILAVICIFLYSSYLPGWVLQRNPVSAGTGTGPTESGKTEDADAKSKGTGNANGSAETATGQENPDSREPGSLTETSADPLTDDGTVRKTELFFTDLPSHERITDGCMADIRIRFANGEDYTVLKNIRLTVTADETGVKHIFAGLSEIELLYVSSARTDLEIYTDTAVYPVVVRSRAGEDAVGNYRPVKDVLTLIGEEGFMEKDETDRLYLARECLEERLQNSTVFYRDAIKNMLKEGGPDGNSGDGVWLIN